MFGIFVARSSWQDVQVRLDRGAVALLPLGAGSKAHGRHLVMGSDCLQAEWLATALAQRLDVVVWPTLQYGYYPAFLDFPGSLSLSRTTFRRLVLELMNGILASGARRLAVLNTGISTKRPLREAQRASDRTSDVILIDIYEGPEYLAVARDLECQLRGGHADELETSIMLAIAPQSVTLAKARAWDSRPIRGRLRRTDTAAEGYSPDGVYGNPTLASSEKGQRLISAILDDALARMRGLGAAERESLT